MNRKLETRNLKHEFFGSRFNVSCLKFERGQILILALIFLMVVLILSAALFTRVASFLRFGSNSILREQAVNLAEAGIDNAIWQLNKTAGSCPSPYCGTEQVVDTTGSFIVTIQDKTASLKTITSTGYIPNATTPKAKRTIKVDSSINGQQISFRYAIQVGIGGVDMEGSSSINGNVYSNKPGVNSIQGAGTTQINGDAWAVGTISSPDPTVTGTKHPNASPQPMPTIDYQYWKDQATAGGVTNCPAGLCKYDSGTINIGPQKYVGKLELSNSVTATMNGPIYVTGDFEIHGSLASLKLNNSFGSNGTVLIVDGNVTARNSSSIIPTNASQKGYILVVTTSTSDTAISIQNHGVEGIFYALDGGAEIKNNDAQATAIYAKQLTTRNSASITYDSGIASTQFSSGPGGSWQIKKGSYHFTTSP